MNGIIEVGFGLVLGLVFAYLANNAVTTTRAIRALPVAWYRKVLVFVAHNYLLMVGIVVGYLSLELYAIWQMGWPDGAVFWSEVMDELVYGRTSKLLLGFYLAIVLIVVYFRQTSCQAVGAKKD